MSEPAATLDAEAAVVAWARSGAMSLTGPADGAGLGPPAPLVGRLATVADVLRRRSGELGVPVTIDPLVVLTERAAIAGLSRQGRTSCGGASRLLRAADGWVAVSLARTDDVELLPAWLGLDAVPVDHWRVVEARVAVSPGGALVEQAMTLGLPAGRLPERAPRAPCLPSPLARLPAGAVRLGAREATRSLTGLVVADLSSLWAGPLCGSLLADAGATVLKIESTVRPDGARGGPPELFHLLNAGKSSVALDLTSSDDRQALHALLARVDVVIEASRPRALEHLGIDAQHLLQHAEPRVWASITAHGRGIVNGNRVGFGDDAAVSGGLVAWQGGEPYFCADAVADPATGLVAAAAVLDALAAGGTWLLDISLAGVAADLAGPTLDVPAGVVAAAPARRPPRGVAPDLGADTADVLSERGVRR